MRRQSTYAIPEEVESKKQSVSNADLLTVSEVADILRVDSTTVRRWVKFGTIDAICLPHQNKRQSYRIKRTTLNKVLDTTPEAAEAV